VELGPLGTSATECPIVLAPGDCDDLAGKTEVLWENLPQRHFFHHKSHLSDPGSNLGRRGGKPATNRLSYDAALFLIIISSLSTYFYSYYFPH
jgi:hypothetical protein